MMANMNNTSKAKEIAEKSLDAYMADTYGKSWTACAKLLLDMGLNETEAEAFLRSKHMRWADDAQGRGNGSKASSAALRRYVIGLAKSHGVEWFVKEVTSLTLETFGEASVMEPKRLQLK
jgi:hypothetical protein